MEDKRNAAKWAKKAIALNPTAITISNLAGCYINDGRPEEALKWADKALEIDPELPQAGNHRGLALLELGRFAEGWPAYEARKNLPQFDRRPYNCPEWDGSPVGTLAIHGEQGLGDEIMFLSLVPQIRERCQRVVIECNPRLVALISNSLGAKCYGKHAELAAAEQPDAYIAMGSLPLHAWPPTGRAYLRPTDAAMAAEPHPGGRKRIGVSWFGGTIKTHSALRVMPLELWAPLLAFDAEYVSLQYGDRADEAAKLGLPHDPVGIADLDRLAARIKSCDLVISVCNTTVHMAGGLGVPCICLTPSKPAWRYGLTGPKMIWYESVQLIRQGSDENWSSVVERAASAIADYGILPGAEPQAA